MMCVLLLLFKPRVRTKTGKKVNGVVKEAIITIVLKYPKHFQCVYVCVVCYALLKMHTMPTVTPVLGATSRICVRVVSGVGLESYILPL